MPSRVTIFRIGAIVMLLLTGIELVACEVVSPAACELSGNQSAPTTDSGDQCLCCCSHIVVAAMIMIEPVAEAAALDPSPRVAFASFESVRIYHPPKG